MIKDLEERLGTAIKKGEREDKIKLSIEDFYIIHGKKYLSITGIIKIASKMKEKEIVLRLKKAIKKKDIKKIKKIRSLFVKKYVGKFIIPVDVKEKKMAKIKLNKLQKKHIKGIEWLIFGKRCTGKTFLLRHIFEKAMKENEFNIRCFEDLKNDLYYLIKNFESKGSK